MVNITLNQSINILRVDGMGGLESLQYCLFPDIILSDTHLLDLILVYGLRTNVIAVTMKTKKLLKKSSFIIFETFHKVEVN